PIGKDVGSPKNDRPDIIEPIEEPSDDDPEPTLLQWATPALIPDKRSVIWKMAYAKEVLFGMKACRTKAFSLVGVE
ncbi:hypothetical protein PY650_31040, partial [Rhizobium calliandrae]|nr:hypothetical protein [Rhizobium calliandrae]